VFDGFICRYFGALRRRKGGLYFAVECVVNKNYKNYYKCSRYDPELVINTDKHHCPFDGKLCKYVRGCKDASFFSNGLPLPLHCSRAIIKKYGVDFV
jgi:hypothetical protein